MSTFGWSNISGIDNDSAATPGGIDGSVQFNDDGINFAGVSDFTYNDVTKTLNVTKILATNITGTYIKPITLVDAGGSYGTNGQVLKSNGLTTIWSNDAAGNDRYVQYNRLGMLAGDIGFQYDEAIQNMQVGSINTNNIIPGTITDNTLSTGLSSQILSSDGSLSGNLVWINNPNAVGGPTGSVQYNGGGVFEGTSNFSFNNATNDLNINGNVGIGSTSAPSHRLQVTGANTTINGTSSTGLSTLLLTDTSAPASQKQFTFQLNGPSNTGDIISIQQGAQFRPIRLNPTATLGQARVSIGTTDANAVLQLDQSLTNRKIVLFQSANNTTQYFGFGVNASTLRYNVSGIADNHAWFAGTGIDTSNEIMRLTGTGNLAIAGVSTSARMYVPSGVATNDVGPAWNNSWFLVGNTGGSTSAGLGLGYNTASNFGSITCLTPTANFRQIRYTGLNHLFYCGAATTSTEFMRINTNGTVSIGNTNSTFPLEVTGTIRSTSIRPNTILDTTNGVGTSGQLLSSTGTAIEWRAPPAAGSNFQVQFNSAGSLAADSLFTYNNSSGFLLAPNVQCSGRITPTLIQDTNPVFPSTGTIGQYLSSSLSGILWTDRPLPYSNSLSAVGAFITTAPISTTPATVTFGSLPRLGKYKISTSVVGFPTASNVTTTVEVWTRQSGATNYSLLYSITSFMNAINVHLAFPTKSFHITLAAGSFIEVVIRTAANTSSNASDPVNIDILECIN